MHVPTSNDEDETDDKEPITGNERPIMKASNLKIQGTVYFVEKMRAKVQPKIHPYSVPKSEVPVQKNPTIAPSTNTTAWRCTIRP